MTPFPAALALAAVALAALPAAGQQLSAEKLAAIKRATVLVKADNGIQGGTGSGFVVKVADKTTVYVATNHHVIDFRDEKAARKPGEDRDTLVEVVFDSGTATEKTARAEVVADDPDRDLAVLRVTGVPNAPAPLDLTRPPQLMETLPVLVCGFPFGGQLSSNGKNPAITIGKATVSSVRTDNVGNPVFVQLDGALNPGNSGGPVVTADGKLVGVAVMTIRGAGIGLAVPNTELHALLAGRTGPPELFAVPSDPSTISVKVEIPLLDPYGSVTRVTALAKQPDAGEVFKASEKDGTRIRLPAEPVKLSVKNGWATGVVRVSRDGRPTLWLQVEFATKDGTVYLLGQAEYPLPKFRIGDGPGDGRPVTAAKTAARTNGSKPGGPDLKDLNAKPDRYAGTKVTFDASVSPEGTGNDLRVLYGAGVKPMNLKFIAPGGLAEQVRNALPPGGPASARITATLFASDDPATDPRALVEVTEVQLLGPEGTATATLVPVRVPAAPKKVEPAKAETPAAAAPAVAADTDPVGELSPTVLAGGGVGAVVLLALGAALVKRKKPKPLGKKVLISLDAVPTPPDAATPAPTDAPAPRRVRF